MLSRGPPSAKLLACVIKLLPASEIYCLREPQRAARVNHRLCTDHPNLDLRVVTLLRSSANLTSVWETMECWYA